MLLIVFGSARSGTAQSATSGLHRLIHSPISMWYAQKDVILNVKIEPYDVLVSDVRVYYRIKGKENYAYVDLIEVYDIYSGKIPGEEVKAPAIEYLIVVMFDEEVLTAPAQNAYYAPFEITVIEREKPGSSTVFTEESTGSDYFEILNPEPNRYVSNDEPLVIAVGFKPKLFQASISAVTLYLDELNVTSKAVASDYVLTLTTNGLRPGRHHILLNGHDTEGKIIESVSWAFQIRDVGRSKEDASRLSLHGKVFSDIRGERVKRLDLNTYSSGFNLYGDYKNIHYRASSYVTSREKTYLQPRNRYFLEVGSDKIGIRFGDINPRFSDLVLWGRRVRGLNAYLKLGYFNLDVVHGQTNRANEGEAYPFIVDSQTGEVIYLHPQTGDTVQSINGIYKTGIYTQNMYGLRPSFGSGDKFQLAFNLLKVKDDYKSIVHGISPLDNVVLAPELYLALDRKRIVFSSQASYSILTQDISMGSMSKSEIDSVFDVNLPIDPADYSDIIILNESTRPLAPKELTSLSYQSRLSLNYLKNRLMITYKDVGSDYCSLGNSFLRTNIRGLSVYDRIYLWDNQLFLNVGYDYFQDKLNHRRDTNPDTDMTLLNTIYVGFSFIPMNRKLPQLNVTVKDHHRTNELRTEYAIDNDTRDLAIDLGYNFDLFDLRHSINLGISGSNRIDDIHPMYSNLISDIALATLRTEFTIPLRTTLSYSSNRTETGKDDQLMTFDFKQFTAGAMYMLLDTRLRLNATIHHIVAEGCSRPNGSDLLQAYLEYDKTGVNIGATFAITQRHHVLLDGMYMRLSDKINTGRYNDYIVRLRYELTI